jgi:hypothetical protein
LAAFIATGDTVTTEGKEEFSVTMFSFSIETQVQVIWITVTTAWHFLGLRMEEMTSIYVG